MHLKKETENLLEWSILSQTAGGHKSTSLRHNAKIVTQSYDAMNWHSIGVNGLTWYETQKIYFTFVVIFFNFLSNNTMEQRIFTKSVTKKLQNKSHTLQKQIKPIFSGTQIVYHETGILCDTASFAEKEWKILAISLVVILVMSVLRKCLKPGTRCITFSEKLLGDASNQRHKNMFRRCLASCVCHNYNGEFSGFAVPFSPIFSFSVFPK